MPQLVTSLDEAQRFEDAAARAGAGCVEIGLIVERREQVRRFRAKRIPTDGLDPDTTYAAVLSPCGRRRPRRALGPSTAARSLDETGDMDVEFRGTIFQWRGPAPYYYVAVPEEESADLKEASSMLTYGWA